MSRELWEEVRNHQCNPSRGFVGVRRGKYPVGRQEVIHGLGRFLSAEGGGRRQIAVVWGISNEEEGKINVGHIFETFGWEGMGLAERDSTEARGPSGWEMGLSGLEKLSCKNTEVALREEQDGIVIERGRKTECGSGERLDSEQGGRPQLYKPGQSEKGWVWMWACLGWSRQEAARDLPDCLGFFW